MAESDSQSSHSLHLLPHNIVIAGETGVGKSSFINLIIGSNAAVTANNVCGVTTRVNSHRWEAETHTFCLWDTPGFGEGSCGNVSPKAAQHALRSLLKKLNKKGGVHLLVICMRGFKVTRATKQIYDDIIRIRDQESPRSPVVAVVTGLETWCNESNIVPPTERWWTQNEGALSDFKMAFCGYACITTLTDDCHPRMTGRYAECQRVARDLLIRHSLPPVTFGNVVVVGDIGAGKSSTVNLVLGTSSAVAANDARAVTTGTSYHDWHPVPTQTFRLWDTPGLGEGPIGSTSPKRAHNAVRALLTELSRGTGVHLLIVCFKATQRSSMKMKQTYDTILALRDDICPNTPLVAVVTELERISKAPNVLAAMDQWWDSNSGALSDYHMMFASHACITTLPDGAHPPIPGRQDECQRLVRELIVDYALPPRTAPAQDLHVVLFGETGVGKSSLVNLLEGWPIARVSPDSVACTLASTEYQFQLGVETIRLWDTAGLQEPEGGASEYMGAIEKAAELVQRLSASGGISLFLFCIRGNRVTKAMQSNYRLFYEVLGKKQVPIALVVTHLEQEETMEDWWKRNAEALEGYGIRANGHACITTLEGHPKYDESRNVVQELLWQYADQSKFSMPLEVWLARLLNGLTAILGIVLPRGRDLVRILTKRCHLEPDIADKVAACIEHAMTG